MAEVSARMSGRMVIVVVCTAPLPPNPAGTAVSAIRLAAPVPMVAPRLPPRSRMEAPAVTAPTAPV